MDLGQFPATMARGSVQDLLRNVAAPKCSPHLSEPTQGASCSSLLGAMKQRLTVTATGRKVSV